MVECPYLEINNAKVVCRATNWGKGLDGKQQFGPLPRSMIFHCSGDKYATCTMYVKEKAREGRDREWQDTT